MDKQTKVLIGVAVATVVSLAILLLVAGSVTAAGLLLSRVEARSQDGRMPVKTAGGSLPDAVIYTANNDLRQPSMVVMESEDARNRFSLSGELQEWNVDTIVVAGQTVQLSNTNLDQENIDIGSYVVVQGFVNADGKLVAEAVYPTGSEQTGYPCSFNGQVDSFDGQTLVVAGKPLIVTDGTQISQDIQEDDQVAVKGIILEKGEVVATDVQRLEDVNAGGGDEVRYFEFQGRVESINPWVVAGVNLTLDEAVQLDANIQVGNPVIVKGIIREDGTWVAHQITLLTTEPKEIVVIFIGVVEDTDPWIVNGVTLNLGGNIVVDDGITFGTLVRVEAVLRPDGTYIVRSIQRIDLDLQDGCFRITDVIVSIEGNRLRLQKWPDLILSENIIIQGDLRPGSLVLVTVCVREDRVLVVGSVISVDRDDDWDADVRGENKVTICHIPPGNPDNRHTITIGESAVDAHVRNHGDTLGPCP